MSISEMLLAFLVMTQDPGQEKIEDWVFRLGADEIESREEAQSALLRIGAPAMVSLQKAASDPDLERACRARTILARLEGKNATGRGTPQAESPPSDDGDNSVEHWFRDPASGRVFRFRIRHFSLFASWLWPFWSLAEGADAGG